MNINNNNMSNMPSFGDQEVLNDALSTEKAASGIYNSFTNECSCATLRNDLMQILNSTPELPA